LNNEPGLFFLFFIYGLAFFGMGLAMAMESWRAFSITEARALIPLAGFGMIHGAHEWLEAYLLMAQSLGVSPVAWVSWARLGMLAASFSSLAVFAYQSLRLVNAPRPAGLKHGAASVSVFVIFILTSAVITYEHHPYQLQSVLDGLARYLLAVPASAMAALGLHYIGQRSRRDSLKPWLDGAAVGFGLYALTQIFVPAMTMFPANVWNSESFRAALGFPIQAVRTALAALIAVCLVRSAQLTEEARKFEFESAQRARLDALEQQQELRRDLLRHIVHAQEDERARIARELHDETAQTLTAFSLELATLKHNLSPRSASHATTERLLDLSRTMSQSLYRLMTGLRPAHLDELGLTRAIQSLVDRDYTPRGFAVAVEARGETRRLEPTLETALFRVAQEALANIARHAGVREGRVEISFEAAQVDLRVSDRGRGFNPDEPFRPPRGWGLEGMRERVEAVGGALQIVSSVEHGTTIEALIPVARESKEAQ